LHLNLVSNLDGGWNKNVRVFNLLSVIISLYQKLIYITDYTIMLTNKIWKTVYCLQNDYDENKMLKGEMHKITGFWGTLLLLMFIVIYCISYCAMSMLLPYSNINLFSAFMVI